MLGLAPRPAPRNVQFRLCTSEADVNWLFDSLAGAREYAWDIETTHPTRGKGKSDDTEFVEVGGRDEKVIGISFCWNESTAAYLPLYRNPDGDTFLKRSSKRSCLFDRVVADLKRELEDPGKDRFTWNGTFDVTWMRNCFGIRVPGFQSDGMMAHALLDETRSESVHKLKVCAGTYIDPKAHQYEIDLERALDFYDQHLGRYYYVPLDTLAPYGCADAYYTFRLVKLFEARLKDEGLWPLYIRTIMPVLDAVAEMKVTGVPANTAKVDQVSREIGEELTSLTAEIIERAGHDFDPGSPEQLSVILFDKLHLTPIGDRGKNGYYSTDKETLASLETVHPIIKLIQRHRRLVKLKGTYVDGLRNLLVGDRYYPDYKLHTTVSGRWTERLVVLLPREEKGGDSVKGLFEAPPGWSFMFRDLSQIELRIAAHVSDDRVAVDGFCNGGPGYDPHAATAIRMFKIEIPEGQDPIKYVKKQHKPKRSISKNINFLSIYGGEEERLAVMMVSEFPDIWPDKDKAKVEARGFLDSYFQVHWGLKASIERSHQDAKRDGFVRNMFGRKRRLPDAQLQLPNSDFALLRPRDDRWKCFGRQSPSLWYDLGYRGDDLPYEGLRTSDVAAQVRALKNPKYLTPVGGRTSCVECDKLAACCYARERRSREMRIAEAYRQAFNFEIQSSAVDYTDYALVLIWRAIQARGLRSRPVLQIHDSLGFLVPDDELDVMADITKESMEHALDGTSITLRVPIGSDLTVCRSWGDENVPSFVDTASHQCPACDKRRGQIEKKLLNDGPDPVLSTEYQTLKRAPTVTIGAVTEIGRCSRYQEMAMACACGWKWQHPAVFQSELT